MDILSDVNISGNLTANSVNVSSGKFTQKICGNDLFLKKEFLYGDLLIGCNVSITPQGLIKTKLVNSITVNSMKISIDGWAEINTMNSVFSKVVSEFYIKNVLQPYYRNYEITVPPECSKFRLYSAETNSFALVDYPPIIQSVSQATGRFIYTDYEIICGNETGSIWHVNVLITPESENRDLNFAVFSF